MDSPKLTTLNAEQQEAVTYNEGPLLIVAGAGTGKTTVIVEKIKHLILEKKVKPDDILALTFTEKAAHEMEERIDKVMPYGYFQMWISTFHSFADTLLREHISHIGLNPSYKLLTQAETILFLKNHLFLFNLKYFRPLGNPNKFLVGLLQHFSRLRDEDISPEQYLKWAQNVDMTGEEKDKYLELAEAYKMYQDIKIKESYFDFSDLMFYLLKLLRSRQTILEQLKKQFKYVLVDEFQDTNIAQYLLMKLLAPPHKNTHLSVVGDDSQAIYKFRGASISNILNFMKDYPTAKQITLNKNYRSHQNILDISHRLIQFNNPDTLEVKLGISKQLISHTSHKDSCYELFIAERADAEADYVSEKILKLKSKKNYRYSDFALLVRANNHADAFISSFIRHGIPYKFLGPGMLFKQPEVKDLIAYLKLLYNLEDSPSLYRVVCMDLFAIDAKDISLLLSFSRKTTLSFFQALDIYLSFFNTDWYREDYEIYKKYLPLIKEETRTLLIKLVTMIKRHLKQVKKDSAGQILYYFLEDTGYLQKITTFTNEKEEKIALNISKFFNKLKSYEGEHEDASVFAIVDYIDMSMELGESPITADNDAVSYDGVNLLTVHAAKGLEFPIVFLTNLIKGRFPTYEKKEAIPLPQELIKEILPEGDYHMQEERRLFYVGLTRAKEKIYLTTSQLYGDGKRERKISNFISESLGEEQVQKFTLIKKEEKTQLSIFDFKKQEETISKEKLPLTNFSYSQIDTFNTCALKYKYQYILKIPTSVNSAASFGDSIHKTLQQFYQEYINDKNVGLERMLEIFKKNWIPLGYLSQSHEKKMKTQGKELLEKYFATFHTQNISIMGLEKLFKIRASRDIFLTGKIDRVDILANGEIEIIDYKTGKKPDNKMLQKSLQLSIYAMAAMDKGLYQKELDKVTLTFYFLQDMEKVSMKRTPQEITHVQEEVEKTVEEIRKNEFPPHVGPWCGFCEFRIICEAWQK